MSKEQNDKLISDLNELIGTKSDVINGSAPDNLEAINKTISELVAKIPNTDLFKREDRQDPAMVPPLFKAIAAHDGKTALAIINKEGITSDLLLKKFTVAEGVERNSVEMAIAHDGRDGLGIKSTILEKLSDAEKKPYVPVKFALDVPTSKFQNSARAKSAGRGALTSVGRVANVIDLSAVREQKGERSL